MKINRWRNNVGRLRTLFPADWSWSMRAICLRKVAIRFNVSFDYVVHICALSSQNCGPSVSVRASH
jgi:hypothetical protein